MIDLKLFKTILEAETLTYITSKDLITKELLDFFCNYSFSKVAKLFSPNPGIYPETYKVEKICINCKKREIVSIPSKNKLMTYINQFIKYNNQKESEEWERDVLLCSDCLERKQLLQKEKESEYNKQLKLKQENLTDRYINLLLNPQNGFKELETVMETDNKHRQFMFVTNPYGYYSYSLGEEKIKEYILNMPYEEFLQTLYWKIIARQIKYRAKYKCQICNDKNNLIVHHKTYQHHGSEHSHLEDLICLCSDCHEKYHNLKGENNE